MMISSFICAAYFVTVRVIDGYCMGVFYYLFPNKSTAYLASDVFVWLPRYSGEVDHGIPCQIDQSFIWRSLGVYAA